MQTRGLDHTILNYICRGNISRYSPALQLKKIISNHESNISSCCGRNHNVEDDCVNDSVSWKNNSDDNERSYLSDIGFPPIALFHGLDDISVPSNASMELAGYIFEGGGQVTECEYVQLNRMYIWFRCVYIYIFIYEILLL